MEGFLADVELMVSNCERFNGVNSPISADGRAVYECLKLVLTHALKYLGPEKDEFTVLENIIKKKCVDFANRLFACVCVSLALNFTLEYIFISLSIPFDGFVMCWRMVSTSELV